MTRRMAAGRKSLARIAFLVCASALTFMAAACAKPKEGGKCRLGKQVCFSHDTALVCPQGNYVSVPCNGPNGCTREGGKLTCDDAIAKEEDNCIATTVDHWACSADKKTALVCVSGKFRPYLKCDGPGGCITQASALTCDIQRANKGDMCPQEGKFACAIDSKSKLACLGGKFQLSRYCRGPSGCSIISDDFDCDQSFAELGDQCDRPGELACSTDKKSEMICQGGTYILSRPCRHQACRIGPKRKIECK